MLPKLIAALGGVMIAAVVIGIAIAGGWGRSAAATTAPPTVGSAAVPRPAATSATISAADAPAASVQAGAAPAFDPSNFTPGAPVTNSYFPLPVGRTLTYTGIKDGQRQRDVVTITDQTKVILGVQATVVHDVADHNGTLLEKTDDWYAQDKQGNVWYLGEDTAAFEKHGKVDRSGSWQAGVDGAIPGIIMESDPQIPDAYRQELLTGQAEDTAWVVDVVGTVTVPYGKVQNALTTLEATAIEPGAFDEKVYGPGLGIVLEKALSGPNEVAKLVSVTGP